MLWVRRKVEQFNDTGTVYYTLLLQTLQWDCIPSWYAWVPGTAYWFYLFTKRTKNRDEKTALFCFFFIFHIKLEYSTFLNNGRHFCFLYKHFPLLPFDFCFLLYCIYLWSAGTVHTCIRNTTYMYILFLKQNEDTKDLFKIS